ncbi:hypothetical protein IACHDJAJ_00045 [Aeromonas phage vB_AdhS_TS3]|nr:hypothetical protein IACHDJAJ_00045 [Aeromonas phage vB_AdhS_TS3]
MFDKTMNVIKANPNKSLVAGLLTNLLVIGWLMKTSSNEDIPLTEYRVVYEHSDNYGSTCGTERGYFWYAEELSEGIFFDHWKEMKWCASTEEQAIKTAQEIIEKRLISEKSKRKSYMAYMSKQDVVIFKDKVND